MRATTICFTALHARRPCYARHNWQSLKRYVTQCARQNDESSRSRYDLWARNFEHVSRGGYNSVEQISYGDSGPDVAFRFAAHKVLQRLEHQDGKRDPLQACQG